MTDDPANTPRVRKARRNFRAAVSGVITLLVAAAVAGLIYTVWSAYELRQLTERATSSANEIADCTTPAGECYERGRQATAAAVQQIIDALTTLESGRTHTDEKGLANQAQIKSALADLCRAQHVSCPSVGVP